jgi:hypothetical protein
MGFESSLSTTVTIWEKLPIQNKKDRKADNKADLINEG